LKRWLWKVYYGIGRRAKIAGALEVPLVGRLVGRVDPVLRHLLGSRPSNPLKVKGMVLYWLPGFHMDVQELAYDDYEPGTTRLVEVLLRPGMTFVDVGANIGYYTVLASRLVGPQGKVYAFEPHPAIYPVLRRNIEANGCTNVIALPLAASNRPGSRPFAEVTARPYWEGAIEVEAISLDEFVLREGWPRVDLIKVDVDGGEPEVVEGMRSLLARSPAVRLIIEFWPAGLRQRGVRAERFLQSLCDLGFRMRIIGDGGGLEDIELTRLARRRGKWAVNLFCEPGAQ
jgi:FkbM family methyltransferase